MTSFKPILTQHIHRSDSHTIEGYRKVGGYRALEKILKTMEPEEVITEVKKSNLRGRGGAGFPTGIKWGFIPKDSSKPTYLICNADEGEPGTFKDRILMNEVPHMILEGIIIASYAINCHLAFIYIRGEFCREYEKITSAVKEAYQANILGENILGTPYNLDIIIHRGAGAYICGEEMGLIESLEGKRGWPRIKPPFPAVKGYLGCPTIVNNVETLACLPHIINRGASWFKSIDPKLFCVSGRVNNPGVFEEPLGVTLSYLIYKRAKGIIEGKRLKAVFPGGSSSAILKAEEIEGLRMDFKSLMEAKTMLGSAGIIVMDETVDMVSACLNIAKFYAHESCGQCTPCREGATWVVKILQRIYCGEGKLRDLDLILDITDNIGGLIDFSQGSFGKTICPFGEAVAWPIRNLVEKFRDEFMAYMSKDRVSV